MKYLPTVSTMPRPLSSYFENAKTELESFPFDLRYLHDPSIYMISTYRIHRRCIFPWKCQSRLVRENHRSKPKSNDSFVSPLAFPISAGISSREINGEKEQAIFDIQITGTVLVRKEYAISWNFMRMSPDPRSDLPLSLNLRSIFSDAKRLFSFHLFSRYTLLSHFPAKSQLRE